MGAAVDAGTDDAGMVVAVAVVAGALVLACWPKRASASPHAAAVTTSAASASGAQRRRHPPFVDARITCIISRRNPRATSRSGAFGL